MINRAIGSSRKSSNSVSSFVGVCLIKNEQNFVAWSLLNAIDFCDEILILDNLSEDKTLDIVQRIADQNQNKIKVIQVQNCNDTHKYLEKYAGTPTWIFKIDGDEVSDPTGLRELRKEIESGVYDEYWMLKSSMLHVLGMDFEKAEAFGYYIARQSTVMCNFNAIHCWRENKRERLRGNNAIFRPGYSNNRNYMFADWNKSNFRTLHLCFFPRSPLDDINKLGHDLDGRENPREKSVIKQSKRRLFQKYYNNRPSFKRNSYSGGEVKVVDIKNFRKPDDFEEFGVDVGYVTNTIRDITDNRRHLI